MKSYKLNNSNFSIKPGLAFMLVGITCNSCVQSPESGSKNEQRPNILVILTDDMNFEDIGVFGGHVLTPTIDSLLTNGVFLSNFYACSAVSSPSRFNFLTGRYASRSKALLDQFPASDPAFLRWNVDIVAGERTIAHVMNENGYYTGLVGKYHNLQNEHIQDQIPEDADHNDPEIQKRIRANYYMLKDLVQETSGFDYLENVYINNLHALALPKTLQYHNMDWITAGAIDFIEKAGNKPFMLFLATTLPHSPAPIRSMYSDPRITPMGLLSDAPNVQTDRFEIIERVKKAGLPESVAPYTWLDDGIGAVIKKLEDEGKLDNTVILFASDHGGNNAKMTCYEHGVRAPAFIYWRNKLSSANEINEITSNIDFAPTLYELCGITPKEDEVIDGISLLPLLTGEETEWRESLFLEITYSRAVVTKDWKYIAVRFPETIQNRINPNNNHLFNQEGTMISADNPEEIVRVRYHADKLYPDYFDRDQLYNLTEDKEEQKNLAFKSEYQTELNYMKNLLKEYVTEFPHSFGEFHVAN
jgi:arylsulfatase A-like enzyme